MVERVLAGTLGEANMEDTVVQKVWIDKRRDLGCLIFIDLRDKSGIVQVVFNPDYSPEALAIANKVRSEFVVEVKGSIVKRDQATVNPAMLTGTIEVMANEIVILNKAKRSKEHTTEL